MSAFEKWFRREYSSNPQLGAAYLANCCMTGGPDSVVWDYLRKTGDVNYTQKTFLKAAEMILNAEVGAL